MKNKVVRALLGVAAVSTVLAGCGPKQEEIVDLYGPAPETEEESNDIEEVPEDDGEYDPRQNMNVVYGPSPSDEDNSDESTDKDNGSHDNDDYDPRKDMPVVYGPPPFETDNSGN